MLLASERKPTQLGGVSWNAPSIEGAKDAPLARARWPVREIRTVLPTRHGAPSLSILPVRLTTNTSLTPFVSPLTRFEASDWKATARAYRLSFEMTGWVDAPLGPAPPSPREIRKVTGVPEIAAWTVGRGVAPEAVVTAVATISPRSPVAAAAARS